MAQIGARHLDRRRRMLPRDYVEDPEAFGVDPGARFRCPDTGDAVSLRIAEQVHMLLCAWNRDRRPSAAALANRFTMSKQTLSRVSRGERWPGETVMAALCYACETPGVRHEPSPTIDDHASQTGGRPLFDTPADRAQS